MMSNSNSGSSHSNPGSDSPEVTAKQGGGPRTPPDSADFDTSASALSSSSDTPSKRHKPINRDEEIACLKETIKNKDADLVSLSKKIDSATKKRDKLLEKEEELTTNETKSLNRIEEDISDMRKDKNMLAAEILELKAELKALKHPKELVEASVPAQGI